MLCSLWNFLDKRNTYIPIADELIDEINEEKKYLVMTLPEGILDL